VREESERRERVGGGYEKRRSLPAPIPAPAPPAAAVGAGGTQG
jgi:hypothetical protein